MNIPTSYSGVGQSSSGQNVFSDREGEIKYDIGKSHKHASIKEIGGRKYVEIDLSADIQKQMDNAADAKEERRIALDYILQKLRGEYRTSDGRIVIISTLGAKKITSGNAPLTKLRTTPHLAEFIECGQFRGLIDAEPKKHDRFKQFAFYDVIFKIGNNWYGGVLNIGILKNCESRLYDLNPFEKIEKSGVSQLGIQASG